MLLLKPGMSRAFRITALAVTFLVGCGGPTASPSAPPSPATAKTLVGIWQSGSATRGPVGTADSVAFVERNGVNAEYFALEWRQVEPSPASYDFSDLDFDLALLGPHPNMKFVLLVKTIDLDKRTMPADLSALPLDDPAVVSRFGALLDAIATHLSAAQAAPSHVLIDNEVSSYLVSHRSEIAAWKTLYDSGIDRLHTSLPGVKVGTVFTFASAKQEPDLLRRANANSDFIDYTYYPVDFGSWLVTPLSIVTQDLTLMADLADGRPFSFTEIGYSSSARSGSSDQLQADFVAEMFQVLESYRSSDRMSFLIFVGLAYNAPNPLPPPPNPDDAMQDFYNYLGITNGNDTSAPSLGWPAFVTGASAWTK